MVSPNKSASKEKHSLWFSRMEARSSDLTSKFFCGSDDRIKTLDEERRIHGWYTIHEIPGRPSLSTLQFRTDKSKGAKKSRMDKEMWRFEMYLHNRRPLLNVEWIIWTAFSWTVNSILWLGTLSQTHSAYFVPGPSTSCINSARGLIRSPILYYTTTPIEEPCWSLSRPEHLKDSQTFRSFILRDYRRQYYLYLRLYRRLY